MCWPNQLTGTPIRVTDSNVLRTILSNELSSTLMLAPLMLYISLLFLGSVGTVLDRENKIVMPVPEGNVDYQYVPTFCCL